jgi:hypothetical protein
MKRYFFATIILLFSIAEMNAQYCSAAGIDSCLHRIRLVEISNLVNASDSASCQVQNGYTDFTITGDTIYLEPGMAYSITSTYEGDIFGPKTTVWVDFNGDNTFDNTQEGGERVDLANGGAPTFAGLTRSDGVIPVPVAAVLGDVFRLRIRLTDGLADTPSGQPILPCGRVQFGEVEDYVIKIGPVEVNDYCDGRGYSDSDPNKCLTDGSTPPGQFNVWLEEFGVDNQFNNAPTSCGLVNGYSDYTNNFIAMFEEGETYAGTALSVPYSPVWPHQVTIWIDWNQDYDFDDPDEIFSATLNEDNAITETSNFTYSITVPPLAKIGITRMRVRASSRAMLDYVPAPCGSPIRGEVEDYTIQVGDIVQCANHSIPTDNQQNLCTNNVTLTWSAPAAGPTLTGYKVYLGTDVNATTLVNGQDVALDTSYTHPFTIPANTKYYWKIITYDANGDAYGCAVDSFTTAINVDPSIDQILLDGVELDSTAVCADVSLPIALTFSGGTAPIDYSWTGDDAYLDDNGSLTPVFESSIGNQTYKLRFTVRDGNGCSARDSVKIFVKDGPVVGTLAEDKSAVCPDETVTLTLTGHTATISDWEKAEGINPYVSIGNTSDTYATTITEDTKFKVLLSSANGCTGESNEITVTLKAAPLVPTLSVSPDNTVCEGDVITLTATPETDIVWNDAGSSTTNPIEVSNNGTFNVTYTDPATTCSATSSDEVLTFTALPADPVITAMGNTCIGNTVVLSTQYGEVMWDLDGTSTAETETIDVTEDGTYTVTYTDPITNCTSTSGEMIIFSPKPNAPVIEQKGDSLITNPLQIVNWLDGDGNVVFTGDSYSPDRTPDQTFTAVAVDGNDCESDESNEVAYDHTVSIARYNQIDFAVFPNPASSELNVQVHSSNAAGMYQIKDMAGRTVIAAELVSGINTISLSEIQSGIYMLQNSVGSTMRIVKQ